MLYKNSLGPYNLRQIVVPGNLTKRFLEKAQSNTFNNLETCGILAGKLVIFYQKYCLFAFFFQLNNNLYLHIFKNYFYNFRVLTV